MAAYHKRRRGADVKDIVANVSRLPVVAAMLQRWLASEDEGSGTLHPPFRSVRASIGTQSEPLAPYQNHFKRAAGGYRDSYCRPTHPSCEACLVYNVLTSLDAFPNATRTCMSGMPIVDMTGEAVRGVGSFAHDGSDGYALMALSMSDRPHLVASHHPTHFGWLMSLAQV